MSMDAMMPGPDGAEVRTFKRSARQVVAGDWLPDYGAHAVAGAVVDPDDGAVWIPVEDGEDIRVTVRKVWIHRRYSAPAWFADALTAYRAARDARNALRESGDPVPVGAVAGAAGSTVAWYQLEDDDFRSAYPAPRLADYIREYADAWKEPA